MSKGNDANRLAHVLENSGVFANSTLATMRWKSRRYELSSSTSSSSGTSRDIDVHVLAASPQARRLAPAARARLGVLEHGVHDVRMNLQHEVPQDAVVDFPLAIERR